MTTTSYALLGLLGVRSWSAYELTQQMSRGLRFHWPRVESRIYREAPNLVAHGLARSIDEHTGARKRTVYSITPRGRAALRRWLAQPSAPPQFESEALVRAMFAEQGTKEDLLNTLVGLREYAETLYADQVAQANDYLRTGGPFPERLHVIALTGRFILDYVALLERWASWAEDQVRTWPDVQPVEIVPVATEVFRVGMEEEVAGRFSRR